MAFISAVFKIQCRTELGESVYLVGNIKELRSWDSKKAIKLRLTKSGLDYCIWESEELLLPPDTSIEYKFFKRNFQGNAQWEWTEDGPNRSLILITGTSVEIFQSFGTIHEEIIIRKKAKYQEEVKAEKEIMLFTRQEPAPEKTVIIG